MSLLLGYIDSKGAQAVMPLSQIDAALADGVRFGMVLGDAGYGSSAGFALGLCSDGYHGP